MSHQYLPDGGPESRKKSVVFGASGRPMSTPIPPEPRNWFYLLLNVASVAFVVTALAYALVPVLEDKAAAAGRPAPPSPLRDALRRDGWLWLLVEAGVVV